MAAFCTKVRGQTQMQKSEGQVALAFSSSACQSICRMPKKLWFMECTLTTGARTSNLKPSPVPNLAPSLPQRISTLSLSGPCLISPNKRKAGGLREQNREKSLGRMEPETKSEMKSSFGTSSALLRDTPSPPHSQGLHSCHYTEQLVPLSPPWPFVWYLDPLVPGACKNNLPMLDSVLFWKIVFRLLFLETLIRFLFP